MKYRFARTALAFLSAAFSGIAYAGDAGKVAPTWTQPEEANVGWDSGDYAYDYSGNIARIGKDLFGYDGANRLTASTIKAYDVTTSQSFRYDRYGNLLQMAKTIARAGANPENVDTTFDVDATTNRLRTVCNPCQSWEYDDAGNQKKLGTDLTYSWDATGAMTELVGSGAHERYVYDANGERIVMISVAGAREVVRRWTWRDAENKVAREAVEHVGENKWAEGRDYVYRGGALLASFESADATIAERHYHVDHLGTPRLITDAGRKKMAVEAYLPFGERAPGREASYIGFGDRMQFTGHERDGDGSPYRPTLDYMHARYYMPTAGRFLSVDPTWESADLGKPQSWNRYSYVLNNPITLHDPDGQNPFRLIEIIAHGIELGQFLTKEFASTVAKGVEGGVPGSLNDLNYLKANGPAYAKPLVPESRSLPAETDTVSISPVGIRFSQSSVNDVAKIVDNMRQNGWQRGPIDIVRMKDGLLTTYDNTRLLASQRAGINVQAVVHSRGDAFPAARWDGTGPAPRTWEEAIHFRIRNQNRVFRDLYPDGSLIVGSGE